MKIFRPKLQGEWIRPEDLFKMFIITRHPGPPLTYHLPPENRFEGRAIVDDRLTVRFWGNWVGFLRGQFVMISKKHQGHGAFGHFISTPPKEILLLMPPGMYKTLQIVG